MDQEAPLGEGTLAISEASSDYLGVRRRYLGAVSSILLEVCWLIWRTKFSEGRMQEPDPKNV